MQKPQRHGLLGCALALIMLIGLGGCQAQSSNPPTAAPEQEQSSAAPTTTTAPSTTASPKARVLADYAEFWDAYVAASRTADKDHPDLIEHATGEALERIGYQLLAAKSAGVVARGEPVRTSTRVTRLEGQTAEVAECLDSSKWGKHDAESGQPLGEPSGRTRQVTATLTLDGGLWRVSVLNIGENSCASDG